MAAGRRVIDFSSPISLRPVGVKSSKLGIIDLTDSNSGLSGIGFLMVLSSDAQPLLEAYWREYSDGPTEIPLKM
jgi:hypothetical protein